MNDKQQSSAAVMDPETVNEEVIDVPQDPQEEAQEEVDLNMPFDDDPVAPPADPATALPTDSVAPSLLEAAEARALRAYADLDNYKKRFDRELTRQRDLERDKFLNGVLGIADNMRRALNVKDAEESPYRNGLLSVMRQIDNMLKDLGAEPIAAEKGQPMDANVHEAVTALYIPGAAHESIIDVVEPGYMIGDRVIRPAKVVVAQGED